MAYKSRQCSHCGGPLPEGSNKCEWCHTDNVEVRIREINPFYADHSFQDKLIKALGENIKADPNDINSQYGLGLVFLSRSQYTRAQECFNKAIDAKPHDPDIYYYHALSLCANEPLTQIQEDKCEKIRESLQASLHIERKRKYLILAMLFRQGAYIGKGKSLRRDETSPAKLFEEAMSIAGDDEKTMAEIERFVTVDDKVCKKYLTRVMEEPTVSGSSTSDILQQSLNNLTNLCALPKGDEDRQTSDANVKRLCDPKERVAFFRNIREPKHPALKSIKSIGDIAMRYSGKIIFLLLMIPVMNFMVWKCSVYEKERQMSHLTADEMVEKIHGYAIERHQNNEIYETASQKREFFNNIEKRRQEYDSTYQAKLQKDSAFLAKYKQIYYTYEVGDDEFTVDTPFTMAVLDSLPANAYHVVAHAHIEDQVAKGKLLKNLPIILLILLAIYIVYRYTKLRKETNLDNDRMMNDYRQACMVYANRPSIEDYKRFCQLYISPDKKLVKNGDIVGAALDSLKLSDSSFNKGKLFFSNFFVYEGGYPGGVSKEEPEEILKRMKMVIAVATGNSIKVMKGIWDTTTDNPVKFDIQNIYYSHIHSIRKTDDTIELIGDNGKILAVIQINSPLFGNVFCYQSVDSSDRLTYSETRTSDEIELERSLDSIIADNQRNN